MIKFLNKVSVKIVDNYFLLCAINAFLTMIGMVSIAKLDLLIMLGGTIIAFNYLLSKKSAIDIFIIAFIASIAIIGIFQNYRYDMWYDGCRTQLYSTIFFFVGRSVKMSNSQVFIKGIKPFLIVCLIGLFLYIYAPAWYMNFKMKIWEDQYSVNRLLEMSRLSAFWTYPYWISYGCAIMYSYLLYLSYVAGKISVKRGLALVFIFLISILAQQRAPLAFISLLTFAYLIVPFISKSNKRNRSLWKTLFIFIILIGCVAIFVISMMNAEMVIRLLDKLEALSDTSSFLKERTEIFDYFRTKTVTYFGDGIGRYSHVAYKLGKHAITDQQYMLLAHEIGYFGILGYGIIFGAAIIKGLKNINTSIFDLSIVVFFLIAMTGANSLTNFDQHTVLLWFCCGHIFNNNLKKTEKVTCSQDTNSKKLVY